MQNAPADPYKAESRKSTTAILVGGILLALLAGFALGASGMFGGSGNIAVQGLQNPDSLGLSGVFSGAPLQQVGEQGQNNTQVGAGPGNSDLNLVGDPARPNLDLGYEPTGPNTQMADKMPADVREWLKHLERTEAERKSMATGQIAQLLPMMMSGSSAGIQELLNEALTGEESSSQGSRDASLKPKVTETAAQMRQRWKDLKVFFNSKQPPQECVPIKNSYEHCLGETSAMVIEILDTVEKAGNTEETSQDALSKLLAMLGTSGDRIDVAGKQADVAVGEICHKYDTFKWFSISGDHGGIGGLGGLGLGGLGGMLGGG
ncbi:MAG: hypothetical protein WD716_13175 [Fimbriimonadaceae bacterium]